MNGLALQIDGKWAVLGEDVSVSVEGNSPIWGEGNSFSLPFELDVEANRHILGNSDQITGQSVYEVLDGKRAILYTLGIPVYYGIIKLDDEVEIDEGTVDITLVSGNLTFEEMIEDMNCQDVALKDRIEVGEGISEFTLRGSLGILQEYRSNFPDEFVRMSVHGISTINVSKPYPQMPYCNARVCYQLPEKKEEESNSSKDFPDVEQNEALSVGIGKYGNYAVLDANRPLSGLCFFVMYFLDCLFYKLNVVYSNDGLSSMEDMTRLAFFSTQFHVDTETKDTEISLDNVTRYMPSFRYKISPKGYSVDFSAKETRLVANSKNFPNVNVSEVIDALKNGFGVKFIYNDRINTMKCVYVKDVLRDNSVEEIKSVEIFSTVKLENKTRGFELSYSASDDNDTSYNYDEWVAINITDSYNKIRSSVSSYSKVLSIDKRIGNAYRTKVDEDAKSVSELRPTLFEVAEFNKVKYGDCSVPANVESVEIGFTPIIQNDVEKKETVAFGYNTDDSTNNTQTFATFLDTEFQYPSMVPYVSFGFYRDILGGWYDFSYTYYSSQREVSEESRVYITDVKRETERALSDRDSGLTLGVMRGPGRDAGVEEYEQNYDGEGNSKYVMVAQDYTFHSDTVDNYARLFDYNGTEAGGVDVDGRFSLKLRAEKPVPESFKMLPFIPYEEYREMYKDVWTEDVILQTWNNWYGAIAEVQGKDYFPITETYAQKRGLFDKFYTEYAYFVVNRKIVRMKCRMEMADILNIDWTKRYKIGDYIGFINKYSYTINAEGMSDVELEMYYI